MLNIEDTRHEVGYPEKGVGYRGLSRVQMQAKVVRMRAFE